MLVLWVYAMFQSLCFKGAISATFQYVGLENWKEKLVALGADGASINLGKKGGLLPC